MKKLFFKKITIYFGIVLIIFLLDRFSKLYILSILENSGEVDIYINSYINFILIWNKGIAFGLLSFNENFVYNLITFLIVIINIIIILMILRSNNISIYFLLFILGGSLGNLFDRMYYSAVPDFIDFHINDFHWFIFNVADIFISLGVLCLIINEIFFDKKLSNEVK